MWRYLCNMLHHHTNKLFDITNTLHIESQTYFNDNTNRFISILIHPSDSLALIDQPDYFEKIETMVGITTNDLTASGNYVRIPIREITSINNKGINRSRKKAIWLPKNEIRAICGSWDTMWQYICHMIQIQASEMFDIQDTRSTFLKMDYNRNMDRATFVLVNRTQLSKNTMKNNLVDFDRIFALAGITTDDLESCSRYTCITTNDLEEPGSTAKNSLWKNR